jgi:transposase
VQGVASETSYVIQMSNVRFGPILLKNSSVATLRFADSVAAVSGTEDMMGHLQVEQAALFYEFSLEKHVPADHLLRSIDRFVELGDLRRELAPFYSTLGRPSVDPELIIRMLIVGYCFGIRSERRLCEEVHLNLAYRWFCRLGLDGQVLDHSTFSKNRHGRFRLERSVTARVRDGAAALHRRQSNAPSISRRDPPRFAARLFQHNRTQADMGTLGQLADNRIREQPPLACKSGRQQTAQRAGGRHE